MTLVQLGFLDNAGAKALSEHAKSAEPLFRQFLIDKLDLLRLISFRPSNDRVVERAAHKVAFQKAIALGLSGHNTTFPALAILLNHPSSFRLAFNDTFRNLDSDVFVVLLRVFIVAGGEYSEEQLKELRAKWTMERDRCLAEEAKSRKAFEALRAARREKQRIQQDALRAAAQDREASAAAVLAGQMYM